MFKLRDYQQEAIDALFAYWRNGGEGNPICAVSTGGGKSIIIGEFVKIVLNGWDGTRVLVLSHVKEIIEQNHEKMVSISPELDVGVHSAGIGLRDTCNRVIFGSVQTLCRPDALKSVGEFDLVIVDECFTGDTIIKTINGDKRIDEIKCGDIVNNAIGYGEVKAVRESIPSEIIKIEMSDGRKIECTPNHPFFTDRGWVKAKELKGDVVYGIEDVSDLWESMPNRLRGRNSENLLKTLRSEVSLGNFWRGKKNSTHKNDVIKNEITTEKSSRENCENKIGKRFECCTPTRSESKNFLYAEKNKSQAENSWGEWNRFNACTINSIESSRSWVGIGAFNKDECWTSERCLSKSLQGRHCECSSKDSNRAGWGESWICRASDSGHEEKRSSKIVRVVSVSSEKQRGNKNVFNIQVSGHPSYYANGLLVHNCHLINAKEDHSMYMRVFNHLHELNPNVKIVGFTATPFRQNQGWLTDGEEAIFHDIVYRTNIGDLIERGYLSNLIVQNGSEQINTDGVAIRGGDYSISQLEEIATEPDLVQRIADDIVLKGENRKGWLVFCITVEHAYMVAEAIEEREISVAVIHGDTPKEERAKILAAYKKQEIRCICNCAVLTTGFDAPHVDMVSILRPTRSESLYCQIVGRGLRMSPETGKKDCLIADYSGCVAHHGPVDSVEPVKKSTSRYTCKECDEEFSPSHLICPFCRSCKRCGESLPIEQKKCGCPIVAQEREGAKLTSVSGDAEILKSQIKPVLYPVTGMSATLHQKNGSPTSLKITYHSGFKDIYEWVNVENPRAKYFAEKWWQKHRVNQEDKMPITSRRLLDVFNAGGIFVPSKVITQREKKYVHVKDHIFDSDTVTLSGGNPFSSMFS